MNTMRPLTDAEMKSFTAVRTRLLGHQGAKSKGYYATAAFKVRPVIAEGLGTWAVDANWRLYICDSTLPNGSEGWTVEQCESVFEHELNHLLRDHALRMEMYAGKHRDQQKSNIATDLEINDDLDPNCFVADYGVLPSKMDPALPDGKTAEWYYDNLPQNPNNDGGDSGDSGDGSGQPGMGNGNGNGKPRNMPNCGSGAGGKAIDGELPSDSDIAPGMSEGEATIVRKATAQAVQQHEQQHGRGSVAGGLSEWAVITLAPPTVPWQRVLGAAIRRGARIAAGNQDFTYTRLSRRASTVKNVATAAMYAPRPRIASVVDTSGSMSSDMIVDALNEVRGIATQLGCGPDELTLIQVDAAVASIKPFVAKRKIEVSGHGGTDMRVGVQAALEMRQKPNIVVVLTDGYTPWPDKRTHGVTMVVGIIGDNADRVVEDTKKAMPWASVVKVGR